MAKTPKPNQETDDLERVIAHLDTQYERGEDCIHPDTEVPVSDGEYDALRRRLKELKPKSKLFATATASKVVSTNAKVVHDPPMTSIEKASHEDVAVQEEQLFKWLTSRAAADTAGAQTIKGKTYKDEPISFGAEEFYLAYKFCLLYTSDAADE